MRHSVRGHPVSDVPDGQHWNRELGSVSEEVVTTLVHQLFGGIRDYLVQARPAARFADAFARPPQCGMRHAACASDASLITCHMPMTSYTGDGVVGSEG